MNLCIAKEIVSTEYGVFVPEDLTNVRERTQTKKRRGKRSRDRNRKLGFWALLQLEQFVRYKAEEQGKTVLPVDAAYTSQRRSRRGDTRMASRHISGFHCHACDPRLHADLNASMNIAQLGTSGLRG